MSGGRVGHDHVRPATPTACACGQPLEDGHCRACAEHLERAFEAAVAQACGGGPWDPWEDEARTQVWEAGPGEGEKKGGGIHPADAG